jgi:hypothetical protein
VLVRFSILGNFMPLPHLADRSVDSVLLVAASISTGFLPIDLESWMLTASMAGAATYYFTKAIPQLLELWERFKK